MNMEFAKDVAEGLSAKPKYLSSKYIYNAEGDRIFQKIMGMPEYYLTNAEFEILDTYKGRLLQILGDGGAPFELVELGAGDGLKTKVLLKHFATEKADFSYVPIDISNNILNKLRADINALLPEVSVEALHGEYFTALETLQENKSMNKVVLLLGSNIGNFTKKEAHLFLKALSDRLNKGDRLIIGFDLKKDPEVILNAYNDPHGYSEAFCKNVLQRINEELGGNFDLSMFKHFQHYHPVNGNCESFLISKQKQDVYIDFLEQSYSFEMAEPIHVEISQKYDIAGIKALLSAADLTLKERFFDSKNYFVDVLCEKTF